jgi:hypothetical protein
MTEDQFAAYRTAKSTRPAWANALIVAGVIALAAVLAAVAGMGIAGWLFLAAGVALLVAGVAALAGVTRRAP